MKRAYPVHDCRTVLILAIACCAALYAGCAHIHTLSPDAPSAFYEHIEKTAGNNTALIRLDSGVERAGLRVAVRGDSVFWETPDPIDRTRFRRQGVALDDVKEIVVINRKKASALGAGAGVVIGGLFGTIPSLINNSRGNAGLAPSLGIGSVFAIAGGIAGGIIGYKKTIQDIYVFAEHREGTPGHLLTQQLKSADPGLTQMMDALRRAIHQIQPGAIREEITASNVIFRINDRPFCYLMAENRRINIYLAVRQTDVSDPQGLLRPWSTGDSWFSLNLGGDMDYAMSLIRQAHERFR